MAIQTGSVNIDFPDLELYFTSSGGTEESTVFINNADAWIRSCPLSSSVVSEVKSGGNRIIKVAFTAPPNNSRADALLNATFSAWNSQGTSSELLPITVEGNTQNSWEYVALPLYSGSIENLPLGSRTASVAVLFQSPYPLSSSGYTLSDSSWITSVTRSIVSASRKEKGNYIAYYTFSFDPNNTGVDRTQEVTFWTQGPNGRVAQGTYSFYNPSGDILTIGLSNPYKINPTYDGRVPGVNLTLPVKYPTQFQGGNLMYLIHTRDTDFHISTSYISTSINGGFVTESFNTRWAQNFTPYPRTGSVNFSFVSGDLSTNATWEIYQAPFISNPYPTPDSETVTVGPDATSLILGVTYYMGSSGSTILSPVVMSSAWPWTIVGQNEVETDNVLTRRFYYTASFGANQTSSPRNQEVSFRISSGSKTNSKTVSITQNSQISTEGYVTVVPESRSISAPGGTVYFTVTYVGNRDLWSVDLPTTDLLYSQTLLGQNSSAVSYSYAVEVPQAVSLRGHTYQITFNMSSGTTTETATGTIKQAGKAGPSISFVTSNPYNISREGGEIPIEVRYLNAYSPDSTSVRVYSGGNRLMINEDATTFEGDGNDFTGRYLVTMMANPSQNSITGSLLFTVTHNNTIEASSRFNIYQGATGSSGSANPPTVTVLNTPVYVGTEDNLAYFRVRYYLPDEVNTIVATPTWYHISSGSATIIGYKTESDTGTVRTVVYTASIGPNVEYDTRILQARFGVISGSYSDGALGTIYQSARTSSEEPQIVLSNPSVTLAANQTSKDNVVTIQYLNVGSWANILSPILTGNIYSFPNITDVEDGDDITRDYRVIMKSANTSSYPITSSVTLRVQKSDNTIISKSFYVYQEAATGSGGGWNPEILPAPSGTIYVPWDKDVQNFEVRYNGVSSTNNVASPTYTGRITNVNNYSLNSLGSYCVGKYNVSLALNSSSNPVTNTITFKVVSGSQQKTETVTIIQNPSGSGNYYINCPEYVNMPAEGGTSLPACTVIYGGVSGSSQIGFPMTFHPGLIYGIHTANQSYGSLSSSRTYTVDILPNTASTAWTSSVTWSILVNGTSQIEAVTKFYQPTMSATPSILVGPQTINVGSSVTSSNFFVTYSNYTGYTVNNPDAGSEVQVTAVSSQESGRDRIVTYTAVYPVNNSSQAVTRPIIFSMVSGSSRIQATGTIVQAAGSSGTQGIFVDNSPISIPYNQTRTLVRVDYYGISSVDAASDPTSTDSSWSATVAGFQEEDNHVSVIWEINSTVNNGNNTKQVVFTFNAVGLSTSALLVVNQGTAGSGTVVGSGIIPAWKDTDTVIGNGDSWEVVCRSSNNVILFDERMYRAPNLAYLTINFNRLAESFLEPREFPKSTVSTPVFFFTTDLIEGGSKYSYEYRVVDDWSYDEDIDIESEYVLSKPYQNEVALGQYLVYSVLRTPGTTGNTLRLLKDGNLVAATTPGEYNYLDFSHIVDSCGTWSFQSGIAGNILQTWTTVDAKYVLYYYNKYAGWDSFVIKGPVIPSIDVTRNTYLNYRRNSRSYQNGVVGKFRVNTGILTDEVSPVVTEFAASPRLVLHELDRDILIPVKVSTDSIERKTFRNQSRQFAKYEFDLEADLSQIRR